MISAPAGNPDVARDYLSYSAIRTFQGCPLRYRFRYVDRLPEEQISGSLVFGSAVHAAVEFYFRQQLAGEPPPDLGSLREVYRSAWETHPAERIQLGKSETTSQLHELADRMLSAFLASEFRDPGGRILGVEEELRGELVPGLPDLLGRIDLLVESERGVIIRDFKTARTQWTEEQADEQSEQLLLYADLVRKLLPNSLVRLQFLVISKTRDPRLQLLETSMVEARLNRTRQVIERTWSAIQAGHFYPAPSSIQCSSCSYRRACRDWRG